MDQKKHTVYNLINMGARRKESENLELSDFNSIELERLNSILKDNDLVYRSRAEQIEAGKSFLKKHNDWMNSAPLDIDDNEWEEFLNSLHE